MNTMTSGNLVPRTASPVGIAALAVRIGRALEHWGTSRSVTAPSRDELASRGRMRREAQAAIQDRDALIAGSSFQPLR
jgi:hypothetical protein